MVTLKNPQGQIPNGYRYLQPETGWDSTKMLHPFPSIEVLVNGVIAMRTANPWLVQKHGWNVEFASVKAEMLEYQAQLCLKHGWMKFINTDESAPVPPGELKAQKKTLSQAVVGGATKHIAAGIGVFLDWIGEGGVPVAVEVAERRANICVTCPKNDGGDWKKYFTEPIAAKIKKQLEIKNDLTLKTSVDDKLTVCSSCDCPLLLKPWTPIEHILAHTSEETMAQYDRRCWVLAEAKSVQ